MEDAIAKLAYLIKLSLGKERLSPELGLLK